MFGFLRKIRDRWRELDEEKVLDKASEAQVKLAGSRLERELNTISFSPNKPRAQKPPVVTVENPTKQVTEGGTKWPLE